MAVNIFELPFRKTHPVELKAAITSYISKHYDQSPAQFSEDLQAIEALRDDAIHVLEPHVSGIARLQRYAAQLQYLSGKFPIDIGVEFPWYPSIGYNVGKAVLQNNIRYELANILFNLSALFTQLAFAGNRTTPEGLKQAAQYGQSAAGVLQYLRNDILPDMRGSPPDDMDTATLESLEQMCLAQAQECFWQKAVKDGMKDGTIARLAAKVSDYYSVAGDLAIKSDAVSTEWIHHFQAKHHHFAAAAQFRQSRDCLEKRKYGEEVARLQDSITCVNEALKEQRWINRTVLGDLQGLKTRVTEELKRAQKDNDVIYLLPVTPKSELKLLDRANMVASKPPKEVTDGISLLGPNQPFGNALFEKLVPYAVHQAASIYQDRKERLCSGLVADLEAMTSRLHDVLQSLNLPGALQALEKPLGLPPSLTSKAEELRQQNAVYRLKKSMEDTTRLKTNDIAIYQEGVSLLETEREDDDRLRSKFGTERWTRTDSATALAKLYEQSTDLRNYLNSAASSDNLVQTKMRENEHVLRIMTGNDRDIESYVPSSRNVHLTPTIESVAAGLRTNLNDLSRLESRRKRRIDAVRAKSKNDDINAALLTEAARIEREYPMQPISAAQFETLFEKRLEAYESDRVSLGADQDEQDQMIARLRESNKNFLNARQADLSSSTGQVKARESALQELENGYTKYKEIIQNLDSGRRFWNDLASHVTRFRDQCQKHVAQRRLETTEMEAELLSGDVGRLKIEETRRALRSEKARQAKQETAATPAAERALIAAPIPTKPDAPPTVATPSSAGTTPAGGVWQPSMGIRFGGPTSQANGMAGYPQPRRPT